MNKNKESVTLYNLGITAKKRGDFTEAIKLFKKAIELAPTLIYAHNNLALCLIEEGKSNEAITVFQKAIKINPNTWDLYYNLANIYLESGRQEKAIFLYKKAIKYQPNYSPAYANLGISYFLMSNALAMPAFKKAIALSPDNIQYLYTLAYIYEKAGDLKNAIGYYEKTVEIDPNYEFAISHLFSLKRKICNWKGLEKINEILGESHKESPWSSLLRTEDLESNLIAGKAWSKQIEKTIHKNQFTFNKNRMPDKKIRLGYISGNFGNHPVSFTTASVIGHHNRSDFEVYAYSYGPDDKSTYREKIKNTADTFIDIRKLSNEEASRKIYDDKIDILLDLTGYTEGNRTEILAMRPAPIQITWAGLSATTGSGFIDYFIADKIIVPENHTKFYTEKMIYIPPCFCPIQNIISKNKSRLSRKDFGLPENKFVFASFNQIYKIDKKIWSAWMNILKNTPESVLWVFVQNNEGEKNLTSEAKANGINTSRIIFTRKLPIKQFYWAISLADLALDTLIYGGGTTTYMSLLGGVPWITLKGKHPASLFSSSVLSAIGLEELSTGNLKEYEKLAVELACNADKFFRIKSSLDLQKLESTILNTKKQVQNLEKSFCFIWKNHLGGKPPIQVEIAP